MNWNDIEKRNRDNPSRGTLVSFAYEGLQVDVEDLVKDVAEFESMYIRMCDHARKHDNEIKFAGGVVEAAKDVLIGRREEVFPNLRKALAEWQKHRKLVL